MYLKNLKSYKVFPRTVTIDSEGGRYADYSSEPIVCELETWPAGGRVQAAMYGERLQYMRNANCYLSEPIKESDGVAVFSDDAPDYKVVSVQSYTEHKVLLLEAIEK